MASRWSSGDGVVLREIWGGHVWSGRPVTRDEGTLRLPKSESKLVETRQPIDALRLATPGADHSVLLLWPEGHGDPNCLYVNL